MEGMIIKQGESQLPRSLQNINTEGMIIKQVSVAPSLKLS
jgi:hypothetical protein